VIRYGSLIQEGHMAIDQSMTKVSFHSFGYQELEESRKKLTEVTHNMQNHNKICIIDTRGTHGDRSEHEKGFVSEFWIPGVGGVKEATHSRNSRYVRSQKDMDRRIIKIVDR
jgi:hypothetical protein